MGQRTRFSPLLEASSRAGSGGGGRSKESGIVGAKAKREENEIERERGGGRVNNLHSDESIVLRQAHATVPIMALQPVDAPTTLSLSLSQSLMKTTKLDFVSLIYI